MRVSLQTALFSASLALLAFPFVRALVPGITSSFQGVNELAKDHPTETTGVINNTLVLIPFSRKTIQDLLPKGQELLPHDVVKQAIPSVANDSHPLLVRIGLDEDVSSYGFSFDFHNSHVSVPFVDRSGDGKTPFIYDIVLFNSNAAILAAAAVSAGVNSVLILPKPSSHAWDPVADRPGSYQASASGLLPPKTAYKIEWRDISKNETTDSPYTVDQIKSVANQGQFQSGDCTYDAQYWNLTKSNPRVVRITSLSLYTPWTPAVLSGDYEELWGVHIDQAGFIEKFGVPCKSES